MSKFYLAHNAGRIIGGERFEIVEIIGGTALGVFQANDEQAKLIDPIVAQNLGVSAISEGEYDNLRKKKAPTFKDLAHSNRPTPQARLSQVAGVVLPNGIKAEADDSVKLETVEAALENVGKVAPPESTDEPAPLKKGKKTS